MKLYHVHVRGWVYALSFRASSEREARQMARDYLGVSRLPRGTAVWES